MTTHVDRLSVALREANPSMFDGVRLAATVKERDALYGELARRLVGLGVRLHQGAWEALREEPLREEALDAAELESNVVIVERVSNGYLVRHLRSGRSVVAASDAEGVVAATADMLISVNELVGEVGASDAPDRVRVIVLPGEDWIPAAAGDCLHLWVERISPGDDWFCPCRARFRLEHEGRSRADPAEEWPE